MNKNVLLKVLLSTLIVFGFKAVSFAQLSPSGQVNIVAPGVLSGCSKDTVFVEFTNTKGPNCPTPGAGGGNVTIEVDIPGDTIVTYQAGSVGSLPAGAAFVSYAAKKLTLNIPVPSYGSTTRAWFLVNAKCNVNTLTPLPTFLVKATYPAGYPTPAESWTSTKMNVGVGSISTVYSSYTTPLNPVVGFAAPYGQFVALTNTGYGAITEIEYGTILSDSVYNFPNATPGHRTFIYRDFKTVGLEPYDVYSGGPVVPGTSYTTTTNAAGQRVYILKLTGIALGADNAFLPGDKLNLYEFFKAPVTCTDPQTVKHWIKFICADGSTSCEMADSTLNTINFSKGTPIISGINAVTTPWDGCPAKTESFTFKNTGVKSLTDPTFGAAYDVDLDVNFGNTLNISNLTVAGGTLVPTEQILPKATNTINFKIKNLLTVDPDGAGKGLEDLDGDGFFDDIKAGDSVNVFFNWEVPCDLACGKSMLFDFTAISSFTDFCGKLNGKGSQSIYKFGFQQTAPIAQVTPLPNFGTMGSRALATRTGRWGFNYNQLNLNLAAATVKLRINYGKDMEIVEPIKFLGVTRPLSAFTKIGVGFSPATGTTFGAYTDTSNGGSNLLANTTDKDSALEYTLTFAEMNSLFDNVGDSLVYSMTHISCSQFQNTNATNSWNLILKMGTANCPTTGVPPCGFDLACNSGFGYQIVEGCGTKPCYIIKDSLWRNAKIGTTGVNSNTPLNTAPTNFYPGDTLTKRFTARLNADYPVMENIGSVPVTPLRGMRNFFSLSYSRKPGTPFNVQPLIFIPDLSTVTVIDTITGLVIATAPLKISHFQQISGGTPSVAYTAGAIPSTFDKVTASSGNTIYPLGYGAYYCQAGGLWPFDGAACPYEDTRYYLFGKLSPIYVIWKNVADTRVSENYYLNYEMALSEAGYNFAPGYAKYKYILDEKWRVNPDYPHTNTGQFLFKDEMDRIANLILPIPGTYMSDCGGGASALGTIYTKDLSIKNPGATYNATCGLTIKNELFLKSAVGDAFPGGEVRVPYRLDSVTIDLPTEYEITSTNLYQYHQSGAVNTGTATNAGVTNHVKWTSTGVGGEFPRMDDRAGNNVVHSIVYAIDKIGTDNMIINSYRVPVRYYLKDEFGVPFVMIDTINIVEGTGDLIVKSIGNPVKIANGNGCGGDDAYMDLIIHNQSIYTAGAALMNIQGNANTKVSNIIDLGIPVDPITITDTGAVNATTRYALLGAIAAGEQRLIRVFFTTTQCEDSLKIYTNFGCNYPAGNNIRANSTTLDSTMIKFKAEDPQMLIGVLTPKINIATLCDTAEVLVEFSNIGNPNLYNMTAGFKLPANMKYVPGSTLYNGSPNGARIQFPSRDRLANPQIVSTGASGDSVTLDMSAALIAYSTFGATTAGSIFDQRLCGLPGPNQLVSNGTASAAVNTVLIKFKVTFTACPTGTSSQIAVASKAESYCGKETEATGVVNIVYVGNAGPANNYSCSTTTAKPLAICAKPGQSQAIPDTLVITNTGGFATSGPSLATDSLIITIPIDTNNFTLSNFVVNGVTVPLQLNAQGKYVLRTTVPAGIPVGGSVNMPITYNLKPKVANLCTIPAGSCASLSFFTEFKSVVSISCPSKGLACTSLATVSRGQGLNARSLVCCAAIGDKVWLDADKDGIQDATGEPGVAGVTVNLYQNGGDGLPGTADDILVGTTVTDAAGNYKFTDLVPSSGDPKLAYNVGFTPPPNYTFTQAIAGAGTDNQNDTNSDANPDATSTKFGRSGSIDLSANEYDSTVDAGLILPTPTTASVGNYVWFDTDKDGIQDPTEKGISGVTVTLYDAAGKVVATTVTDADGKYLFDNVKPGTGYTVGFTPPVGLVPTTSTGPVSGTMNSDLLPTGLSAPFNVMAGDTIRYVDAGFVPQAADKASLGDQVFYDLDKDGIQDPGELGVGGVTVNLLNAAGAVIATTKTDELGNYVFNNLDAGTYSVEFIKPAGFDISPKDNPLADDTKDSDADPSTGKSGPVTLVAGEKNMTVDMGISKTSMTPLNSLGDKVWYDADKDGNQDATEPGVAGLTVKLYNAAGAVIDSTVTDANGNYLFPGLPDGSYSVGFSNLPAGYGFTEEVASSSTSAANSDANAVTGKTAPVALAGGTDYRDLDAGIYPKGEAGQTASLGNKVFYDLNNDGIQQPGETGVAGVIVTLKDAGPDGIVGTSDDGPTKTTTTNGLGEYIFTGLPASNYAVEFSNLPAGFDPSAANAGGDDTKDSDGGALSGGKSTTTIIPLAAGEENLTVDLGIYNPVVNSIGNYVWIDVNGDGKQDATDVPVAGAMATLLNADGSTFDKDPSTPGVQPYVTTTDATGAYLFTGLPDGTYKVAFSNIPKGYEFTTQNAPGTNIGNNSDANSSGVTGPVSVSGGSSNLTLDAGIKSTTKAALGNYVWNDEDGDGVQDPTEKGIAGVKVTVYDAAGNPVASTVTDADGKYFFPNLDPGTYTVGFENLPEGLVFSPQNATGDSTDSDVNPLTGRTAPVTLAAGDVNLTVDAGVTPKPVGGLGNYVWFDDNNNGTQDVTEKPAAGVIVTLKDAVTGAVIATAVTDGDGYYNFPNLTPGTDKYVVTFSNLPLGYEFTTNTGTVVNGINSDANPATGTTGTATVTAGTNNPNVDAGLVKPSAAIGDKVWLDKDNDGTQDVGEEGVGGVTVTLFDANGKVVGTTVTDALGNYKFSNLPAGQYSVGFTPPANYTFTPTSSSADNNNNLNSDANPTVGPLFGRSGIITLSAGEYDSTIDAGLVLPKPTTASVGNYVWLDTDGNGVQDPTEKGISGVTVTLKDATGKVIATTITDADGKYLFDNVAPGIGYTVTFTPPVGYIPTTQAGGVSNPTNSDMLPTGTTAPFNVLAGDTIRYVDAGFVPQNPNNASLGNKVWYDANSDGIQDPGESGVEGITVNLLNASGDVIGTSKTDALGNYIFNNLAAGTYGVEFVKTTLPAGFTFTSPNQGADDSKDGDANPANGRTGLYSLLPGEKNMTVDAGVINATNTNSIGDKVWLDANKDGIQDPTEPGVGGVTVKLYNAAGMVVATTVTDKDGNYKFNNLPNGDYSVGFSNFPTGLDLTGQNTPGSNAATGSDADPITGRTAPVTLTGNTNITNLDAGLYPQGSPSQTASLGNKVFYDLDNDGTQDAGETGVPGVTVTLKDAITGLTIATTTNALGEYIFTGLPAGSYVVEFSNLPAGYATSPQNTGDDAKDSDGSAISGFKSVTAPVNLKAGEENLTVDLGLNKPNVNSIGNYVWIDQNKDGIQDATEVPVAGVMATLLNGDGTVYDKDPTTAGIQPYVTTTDANGNYLFTDLPDSSYKVVFSNLPNGYTITGKDLGGNNMKDSDVDPATKTTGVVTVGPANRIDTTLDAGIQTTTKAALGNYVWNDADGDGVQDPTEKGIAGVVVTVYDAAGNPVASTITDADGKYFFPNLNPGTYTVGFGNLPAGMTFSPQTAGSDPTKDSNVDPLTGRTAPVTLAAGDVNLTVDAGVRPKPTGGLGDYVWFDDNANGVQDANEKPAPGVTATLKDAAGNVIAVAVTDGDGKYSFPNLEPGDYTVTFTTLPQGFKFTNTGGADNNTNSDANPTTGVTLPATVVAGQVNNKVDAGLVIITLANQSLGFTAVKAGNTSNLQFTVSSVPTGSYFEIERSLDGINFENIGSLNSTSANTYNYVDATPNLNARNFYRVKMIESNGRTSTSEVRLVRFTKSKSIEVFPVPAKTSVNVVFNDVLTGKAVTLAIYGTNGQVVFKKQYGRANSSEIIDVTNFANGSYILQIITNNEVVETRKIQVIK